MIIDFHAHAFPQKIAAKALDNLKRRINIEPYTDGTADGLVKMTEKSGVDAAVELNIATNPGSEKTINRTAAENAEKYKNKLIPFGSVNPHSENAVDIIKEIHFLGLKGIKFHPEYQDFYIDDKNVLPLYEEALKLGLILIFHAGYDPYIPDSDRSGTVRCAAVAKEFSGEKIVFAHMGSNCNMACALEYFGDKNVYLDTSYCASYCKQNPSEVKNFKALVNEIGSDKILLGSDCPWEDEKESVDFIKRMDFDENTKEAILGLNAKRLLRI